jgi:uncharacterized membrane protein
MGWLDVTWHVLGFLAPAFGLGGLAAALAKGVFRRELGAVPWRSLAAWASGGALAMLIAGLVFFGRDGRMATYGAMVVACAVTLWWRGFVARR